uniref:SUI1 domain-containing protein n=1 Tax=Salix viminalis TaxID=40686 RepID=A0A6N2NLL7_SALVM
MNPHLKNSIHCLLRFRCFLDKCLLQALHTTVMTRSSMPGALYGAFEEFLSFLDGRAAVANNINMDKYCNLPGMISVREDKYKKETVLFSVNRRHLDYLSFKPERRQEQKVDKGGDQAVKETQSPKLLEVSEIYKPSIHVNPIFASVGADTGKLYSALEASDVVFKYIEKGNLVKPMSKSIVVLDPTLCDALFKGAIKKGSAYPTEIHKKDLGSTFVSRMQAHHIVTRGSESVVRKGSVRTIQILTERRQGNKKVTKLSGMETFLMDADALASELQKKFACSTSVTELPGKKGHEVLIQGGVIDDLGRHLVEQYGVPKRYIEILDKTKNKMQLSIFGEEYP